MRRHLTFGLLAASTLAGCSDHPGGSLIAILVGSVLLVLLAGFCGVTLYTGAIAAGAINIRLNLKQPTKKARRWGFVWGGINLLNGAVGVELMVMAANNPKPEGDDPTAWLMLVGGTLAAFVVGGGGLWAAIRAKPVTSDHPA